MRQTQGFLSSLLDLIDVELDAPDYSTLSRRTRGLDIALKPILKDGPLELSPRL